MLDIYKEIYKCNRCSYTSTDDTEIKKHKQIMHGDYGAAERILNKKYTSSYKEPDECDKIVEGNLKLLNDDITISITYEWDSELGDYRMFTDDLEYDNHLEIVYDDAKGCYRMRNGIEKLRESYRPQRD